MSQVTENTRGNADSSTCLKRFRHQLSNQDESNSKRVKSELHQRLNESEDENVLDTYLNDDVLFHISGYLNWKDTINLAAYSGRFQQLTHLWVLKRYEECSVDDYMTIVGTVPEYILPKIASDIRVLEMNQLNIEIMKSCKKVESLRITCKITNVVAPEIKTWIRELKLKHLRFIMCQDINVLLYDVKELQELEFIGCHHNSARIIAQNINLERLSIGINKFFNYLAFQKLQALQCLHIRSFNCERSLTEIQKFANFGNLREFSFDSKPFTYNRHIISFLKHLAKESKLDKLQILNCKLNDAIFDALKAFNLSALSLFGGFDSADFTNFILENPSPRLKHLKLSSISPEQLAVLLVNRSTLQSVCLQVEDYDEYKEICDDDFIMNILQTCRDRSLLEIHIMAGPFLNIFPLHTEIHVDFINQHFKKMLPNDDFYCSVTKSFNFSSKRCFD